MPAKTWTPLIVLLWGTVLITVLALFAMSLSVRYHELLTSVDARPLDQLNISAASYASYMLFLDVLVALTHILIGAVIFLRKPDDRVAIFVSLTLIINGCILPLTGLAIAAGVSPIVAWVDRIVIFLTDLLCIASTALRNKLPKTWQKSIATP